MPESPRDRLLTLQHYAIETINRIVECNVSFEDRHDVLNLVRKHLEVRAEQTKPSAMAMADLLGDFTS